MKRETDEFSERRERVMSLYERDGELLAQAYVDDARDPSSPLHKTLEWDDVKGGELWRLQQARVIIRSFEVVKHTDNRIIVAPVFVKDPDTKAGYVAVAKLEGDNDRARRALIDEFTRIRGMAERSRKFAAVVHLENELDVLLQSISEFRRRADDDDDVAGEEAA